MKYKYSQLPRKELREIGYALDRMQTTKPLALTFQAKRTGRTVSAGGVWDSVKCRYIESCAGPVIELTERQYDMALYAVQALQNTKRRAAGEVPISDIIFHGPRRGGKSVALAAIMAIVLLAKPGRMSWVVGKRRKHGNRIITLLRRWLPVGSYTWDKRTDSITLANHARLEAKAEVNHDADRGDSLYFVGFDEAAFQAEAAYSALAPSVADNDGFCGHFTSPAPPNWFSRLVEKSKSHDPQIAGAIKVLHARPEDNVFKPHLAERMQEYRKTLSKEAFERECLGLFTSDEGRVLPGFQRETHVIADWLSHWQREGLQDATDAVSRAVLGISATDSRFPLTFQYLVGLDYNVNPSCGSIVKLDSRGFVWYLGEVLSEFGTEALGREIELKLAEMGCDDPYRQAVLIADASGEYQDPKGKKFRASSDILRRQGWLVYRPSGSKRVNPGRHARMETIRSMTRNAEGEIRLFVDASCEETINTFLEMELNTYGLPSKAHPGNHLYDAATYPLFRVWGTRLGEAVFKRNLVDRRIQEH